MRARAALLACALLVAGCGGTARCKPGTLLLSLSFTGGAASANTIDVTVSVDGMGSMTTTLPLRAGPPDGTIEIDFAPSYPAGHLATVSVVARVDTTIVGAGSTDVTLAAGCSATSLTVGAASDLGVPDIGDFAVPDIANVEMAPCGNTVYVSQTTGNDAFTGCDPRFPTQTITQGLVSAGLVGATQVKVCKGDYVEHVRTSTASIYGGYDCAAWTRATDYGYPTFNPVNATVLSPNGPSSVTTLEVTGNVTIDGLTVNSLGAGVTVIHAPAAIAVYDSAPTISNCSIHGGAATVNGDDGGHAVYYGNLVTGTPVGGTLTMNAIEGGSPTGTNVGSIGVMLNADLATPHIIGNTINGGSGTSTNCKIGSIGLFLYRNKDLSAKTQNAVEGNVIQGGRGSSCNGTCATACAGSTYASMGVDVSENIPTAPNPPNTSLTLELIGNAIDAVGGGMVATATGSPIGIYANGRGAGTPPSVITVRLLQNRIYGGIDSAPNAGAAGVQVSNVLMLEADNNMIHGGDALNPGGQVVGLRAIDIVDSALIRHNTLVGGRAPSVGLGSALLLKIGTASTPTAAVVENNILASFGDVGLRLDSCPTSTGVLQSLRNNLFVNDANGVLFFGSTGVCPPGSASSYVAFTTIDQMNAALGGCAPSADGGVPDASTCDDVVTGNVAMRGACSSETGCVANAAWSMCPSAGAATTSAQLTACFQSLFGAANWDGASNGYATLFSPGPGWKLAGPVPCAVVQSSLDLTTATPPVKNDLYGNTRSTMPSMGAYESQQKGACL
jgi:hypothetical protein